MTLYGVLLRQVHLVMKYMDLSALPPKVREAAEKRLENPHKSLGELAELLGISKSGLAHRFQKISALAREFEAREKEERK